MWRRQLIKTSARRRRCMSTSRQEFEIHGALTQLACGELPAVGVDASVTHAFSLDDTTQFARLTGDSNPIHTDAAFALQHAGASAPIVQGMLTASLFATIFGKTIPGAVYVSQQLRWRAPLLVDEAITARIKVVRLRKRFVDCETVCEKVDGGDVVVEGLATVLLPPAQNET
ncbi:Acyl dehydratase, partial [Globisporangium splendens]